MRLKPRLEVVAEMLAGMAESTVADIGCDHGRLAAALLQKGLCSRVIASDISADSVKKAEALREKCGLGAQITCIVSAGMSHLTENEADIVVIAGMGGQLIADIMQESESVSLAVKRFVLQPMRGVEELRRYLFEHSYHVENERVVFDGGRYYQVICVSPAATCDEIPPGFPDGCFEFGYFGASNGDPMLVRLLEHTKREIIKRVTRAREKGVALPQLESRLAAIEAILCFMGMP